MSQAGVIEFESAHPTVPTSFVTDDGTAIPIANVLEILGTVVANHHIPLETTGSGNTVTVVTQYAAATVATTTTDAGVASFKSSDFTVDANGFVSLSGTGAAKTITGNTGGALSPIAGNWNIFGGTVAAGTTPVATAGAGNTLTANVQISQAIAATNVTNIGLSAFNSANFTVDANGFVSLKGGGAAIESVAVQTGTSPIVPTAGGQITINGATVLAGTNPVRTDGTGANTMAVEVQISQAIAGTDATKIGLAAFNSTNFTVDANGFVAANGSSIGQTITGNTGGALHPTAGNWNIFGGTSLAGTTPVATAGSGSTLTANVQISQAIVATDATKIGLAAFNSANFTVDANGFVSLTGGGAPIESVAVQTGTSPIVPTAGGQIIINGATVAAGTHPVRTDGTGPNTMAVEVQISQAIAATDATKIGLSAFNDAQFTVDANGFVSIIGGTGAIEKVGVDANTAPGTNPVVPDGTGEITVTGGQVAAGTTANVIQTNSLAANTYTVQVQRSQAVATSTIGDNGVSHFDNFVFSVDGNGFVQIPQTKVSFNPLVTFAGGSTGVTYANNTGEYIKFGQIVFFTYEINLTSKGSSTGELQVVMPFTNILGTRTVVTASNITMPASSTYLVGFYESATNYITYGAFGPTGGTANLDNTNLTNTAQLNCTGFVFLN